MLSGLIRLKSKVDRLNIGKLETISVDLSKLSDVVKNEVVKKTEYNAKIKDIEDEMLDIINLPINTALNSKINAVKDETPSINNVATNDGLKAKIYEVKEKIPSITNLATTTAFTAVESKIPNVSNLIKKIDYNTEISENKIVTVHYHDKYIATPEFNKLIWESFTARLKQANLASKVDIANFAKKYTIKKS